MNKSLSTVLIFISVMIFVACHKSNNSTPSNPITPPLSADSLYFPPTTGTTWSTTSAASLGWNTANLSDLNTYLQSVGIKAFIILKDGK